MEQRWILLAPAAAVSALSIAAPASAQQWKIDQGESISLEYRNAADTASMFAVSCAASHSDIAIPVPPGTKPQPQAPELRVMEKAGVQTIKLTSDVCGGATICADRPAGDVSAYLANAKGKQLALRFAHQALSLEFDAPGAKLSMKADNAVFTKFAAACRRQK